MLRVSCIFVADGGKTRLQWEDSEPVEPLVCRVRVMVLRVVFCALVTVFISVSSFTEADLQDNVSG